MVAVDGDRKPQLYNRVGEEFCGEDSVRGGKGMGEFPGGLWEGLGGGGG